MFEVMLDPQLTTVQPQIVQQNPDPWQVIPESTASLVDWIKAPVKSVYPTTGDWPSLTNAKWNSPDKVAGMLLMQAMLTRHHKDRDIHLLTMLPTWVTVTTVIEGDPFTWVLPCKLTAAKSSNSLRSLIRFIISAALYGLHKH